MNQDVNGSAAAGFQPAAAVMNGTLPKTPNHQQQSSADGQDQESNIVRFETNVPQEVALSRQQPYEPVTKSTHGYADQICYFLTGRKRMYVPLIVRDQIEELNIQPEEPILVLKREGPKPTRGTKRPIQWRVERAPVEPVPPHPPQQSPAPRSHIQAANQAPQNQAPAQSNRPIPMKVPYDVAFREILVFVIQTLKDVGEQWTDQAKQDMVSTLVINASKDGLLTIWTRPDQRETPVAPISTPARPEMPFENPNPSWAGIDVGPHKPGTPEAQAYVAARRIAELQNGKPGPAVPPELPANPADVRQAFRDIRQQLGEVRYWQEVNAENISDPIQLPPSKARQFYKRLASIARQEAE